MVLGGFSLKITVLFLNKKKKNYLIFRIYQWKKTLFTLIETKTVINMNKTEILSNGNSTIICLINYNQHAINVYKIFNGKLILQQKMYLNSELIRTFMIYDQFYLLSHQKSEFFSKIQKFKNLFKFFPGSSSIYKWTGSNFILIRNFEKKFNYFKSKNNLILAVENNQIQFYTKPELNRISSEITLKNQTDFFIHKEYLIEFFIQRYKMLIEFKKFELQKENEKILEKIKNNSLLECLAKLKTNLFERNEKIQKILINKSIKIKPEINLKNSKIEKIKINLKPIISSKELMRRITILEMRLDDFLTRKKRSIQSIHLNTIVVNNLIHNGEIFKGNFFF